MKDLPVRKSNRLKDYDYSRNGAYFMTICVKDRHELLGKAVVGAAIGRPCEIKLSDGRPCEIELSDYGVIVDRAIQKVHEIYQTIEVDKYVIMPNHMHMILLIDNGRAMRAPMISTVINQLKG